MTEDQIIAVTVFVTVRNDEGKPESHCVSYTPKGARKILRFLKHNVCGGRLVLSHESFDLTRLENKPKLIVPP